MAWFGGYNNSTLILYTINRKEKPRVKSHVYATDDVQIEFNLQISVKSG